ncbi:MAG TPA: hypothetical protein VN711_01350 [Candidatus Saccharimonadales bacterium]|nr:hypothetical protein [Candidatus Saccharimonadales bacterium]
MEIAIQNGNTVRIKGKLASFLVNPDASKVKAPADGTLLMGDNKTSEFFQENLGVVFQGAGEYEVKGAKVTGVRVEADTVYTLSVDGVSVYAGKVSTTTKAKDKLHEHDMVLLEADEVLTQAIMGQLSPRVILFYGEKAAETVKSFGKEAVEVSSKYAVTKDKLPLETVFVLLG